MDDNYWNRVTIAELLTGGKEHSARRYALQFCNDDQQAAMGLLVEAADLAVDKGAMYPHAAEYALSIAMSGFDDWR